MIHELADYKMFNFNKLSLYLDNLLLNVIIYCPQVNSQWNMP